MSFCALIYSKIRRITSVDDNMIQIKTETLLALNYNSFILSVGIIGVDSHARDMHVNNHSQGTCALLEIPSILQLVQYFQSLCTHRNEDIYEFKGGHIANFEVDLCSSSVE